MSLLQSYFRSTGDDVMTAKTRALALIEASARQQASVMSFESLFHLSTMLLVLCIPLVFTLKDRVGKGHARLSEPEDT
jgi:hypothetical protein